MDRAYLSKIDLRWMVTLQTRRRNPPDSLLLLATARPDPRVVGQIVHRGGNTHGIFQVLTQHK
jgi:hypothetical protein